MREENVTCLVCQSEHRKILGIRGNREYSGADPRAEPHLVSNVAKCKGCGFIYMNPPIKEAENFAKEHYSNAQKYRATANQDPFVMFQKRLDIISGYKAGGNLLDIGAGKGEFLYQAQKMGYAVFGVEPSAEFCGFAKKNYDLKLFHGHLDKTDELAKYKYDIITMLHVLEHVDEPHGLMKSIQDLLSENGILFVEVPNTESFSLRAADYYFKMKGLRWSTRLSPCHPPFHQYGYNSASLNFLLKIHGYDVLKMFTLSGQDRGFEIKPSSQRLDIFLRDLTVRLVQWLGNREQLCAVAKLSRSKKINKRRKVQC